MTKDDTYYSKLYEHAYKEAGSYTRLAKTLGAPSGPAVQMWRVNGVAHRWRPVLDRIYGASFRKSLKAVAA
jgi:hypothetical protein